MVQLVLHITLMVAALEKIFDLARQGQIQEAYQLQHDSNDIIETVLSMGIYPTLKEILRHRGIDAGLPKRPFKPLTKHIDKH